MIFVKSCKFPLSFFSHKMKFEIMFDDHPVRKQALLKYKNIEFIELPNPFFPKELNQDFGQKLEFSSLLVFEQNGLRNDVS